ncbi:L-aspartate oxidase [Desulfotomaculum nigrificans CO-1-SRB]|uniref:L-aspartate oxidase n=1 Tax=Desulfotomaculum nigrificans (strain DSM 14880 / VKM B-2319 / CO-1-SRB) TaxID=868595 RepID=F6B542_DESCC|nr:L-aspartate oxidase [Desulfotomaculum nigrificans]AEF93061.1 L-aspartate oxidase [Desulfotomaculum nigrificans CO-1-SRB]
MAGKYLVNFNASALPQVEAEYLIIGGGIAGLFTAWAAAQAGAQVTLLTKRSIVESNTDRAQGGIAAALGQHDSPELHMQDTLVAGAGLCDEDAVRILVTEGPDRVRELIDMGACFDRTGDHLCLTREGCHSQHRILHAQGDATGAEILRTLYEKVVALPSVEILEDQYVVDLLVKGNICYGVLALDQISGEFRVFWGQVVILATGGSGRLYNYTTNPEVATADGIALAYRAGAEVMDMEFIQFHPTSLVLPDAPRFLISEAVRGEGALLRNARGERFMPQYHGMAELAPRDIVSRAILSEMAKTGANSVFLDLTHLDADKIKERFPTITLTCSQYGLDITKDLIPVAPAAHYMMGGVKTDLWGQTSIERLFSCGEASCLAVHGANRLASNSLLDGLVFGGRIVQKATAILKNRITNRPEFGCQELLSDPDVDFISLRTQLQQIMGEKVGPLRTAQRLAEALAFFDRWAYLKNYEVKETFQMEVRNMLEVGELITEAAMMRTESRGGHFRLDYPETSERWRKHILLRR